MGQVFETARVISQEKGFYQVEHSGVVQLAEVSGRLRFDAATVLDYPAVGDYVQIDPNGGTGRAVIHGVLERRSVFVRRAAGGEHREQVVAANIDTVFLCMALNADFNLRRLERYLSIGWESGAAPVVVLTKADLCDDVSARVGEVSSVAFGVDVVVTSSALGSGADLLEPYLAPGRTVAFIGSSGVGKSSLINLLLGEGRLATREVRADGKGRHTTTHRELLRLKSGAYVIDTPGMRELGMWDNATGIDRTFNDIEELAATCRFADCSHTCEPGCAVRAAIDDGTLAPERWESYRKLMAETAYMQDSAGYLAAKERKFKQIARMNHAREKGTA